MRWNVFTGKCWSVESLNKMKGIYISGFAYILAAVSLLLLPLRWMISFVICAAIHEAAHILCAVCMGIKIERIRILAFGVRIYTGTMTGLQELICAMAGPIVGLLPVLLHRYCPEAALISLLLSAYNLLPIYPADGARILQCILEWLVPYRWAELILYGVAIAVTVICCLLCVYAAIVFKSSVMVLVAAAWLPLRIKMEIQLAKQEKKKYNNFINA